MARTSGDHARPEQTAHDAEANGTPLAQDADESRAPAAPNPVGVHVLLDLYGATHLDDPALADTALRKAAEAAGATVLSSHVHEFASTGGVSGVVVLAESHISIHTWPEHRYAALDIFLCGDADPHRAIPVLTDAFSPERIEVSEQPRGQGIRAR